MKMYFRILKIKFLLALVFISGCSRSSVYIEEFNTQVIPSTIVDTITSGVFRLEEFTVLVDNDSFEGILINHNVVYEMVVEMAYLVNRMSDVDVSDYYLLLEYLGGDRWFGTFTPFVVGFHDFPLTECIILEDYICVGHVKEINVEIDYSTRARLWYSNHKNSFEGFGKSRERVWSLSLNELDAFNQKYWPSPESTELIDLISNIKNKIELFLGNELKTVRIGEIRIDLADNFELEVNDILLAVNTHSGLLVDMMVSGANGEEAILSVNRYNKEIARIHLLTSDFFFGVN